MEQTVIPSDFVHPESPAAPVWPLGSGLVAVGYSHFVDVAMLHLAAPTDQQLADKVPAGEVLVGAPEVGNPRCTLIFETPEALESVIDALVELRRTYPGHERHL